MSRNEESAKSGARRGGPAVAGSVGRGVAESWQTRYPNNWPVPFLAASHRQAEADLLAMAARSLRRFREGALVCSRSYSIVRSIPIPIFPRSFSGYCRRAFSACDFVLNGFEIRRNSFAPV